MKTTAFLIVILLAQLHAGDALTFNAQGSGTVEVNPGNQDQSPVLMKYPQYPVFFQPGSQVYIPGTNAYQVTGRVHGQITVHGDSAGNEEKEESGKKKEEEIVKPKPKPSVLEWSSYCYAKPNTEELVGSKSVFVTYPGLPEEAAKSEDKVTLKVFNEQTEVMTFRIPEDEIRLEKVYRFALNGATAGKYSSQLCVNVLCSEKSAPSTDIDIGMNCDGDRHSMNCQRILKDKTEISLFATLVPVEGLANEATMEDLKTMNGTVAKIYDVKINEQILVLEDEVLLYTAIMYPIKTFREFMRRNDICKRKDTFVILTYVVDKSTQQVVKIGRLTPYMPTSLYEKYLGINPKVEVKEQYQITVQDLSKVPSTPIELLTDIKGLVDPNSNDFEDLKNKFTLWHIPCLVRKDGSKPGITRCAEPYIHAWNYKKYQPEPKKEEDNNKVPIEGGQPPIENVPEAAEEELEGTTKKPVQEVANPGGIKGPDSQVPQGSNPPVSDQVDDKIPDGKGSELQVPQGAKPPVSDQVDDKIPESKGSNPGSAEKD